MSKGIIYVMTTVVKGLVKIGKTGSDNFEKRMYFLESNGYKNIVGLKRKFAIEVEDYDEKEKLIQDIFSKSRIPNSEIFALDIDLVIQLLASFEGKQIYPETKTKEEIFGEVTKEIKEKTDSKKIPNGIYYLSKKRKGFGVIEATMKVEDGLFIVLEGSTCAPSAAYQPQYILEILKNIPIKENKLPADVECNSPSMAANIVTGTSNNGWVVWKTKSGDPIGIYRD